MYNSFVYGKVVSSRGVEKCYCDSSVTHPYVEYRIIYPNSQDKDMFKDLPSVFIGKLPTSPNYKVNLGTGLYSIFIQSPLSSFLSFSGRVVFIYYVNWKMEFEKLENEHP